MDIVEAYIRYTEAGVSCLPCKIDKSPMYNRSWKEEFNAEDFFEAEAIGLKCGSASNGLECIDIDNVNGVAESVFDMLMRIDDFRNIVNNCYVVVEKTQRGGYHLIYRCDEVGGNVKLANNSSGKAIIETRGEGGYFIAYPSKGYDVLIGDIFNIGRISEEQREVLMSYCKALDKKPKTISIYTGNYAVFSDFYNRNDECVEEAINLLLEHGWVNVGGKYWRRNGKSRGISATWGHVGENLFYVFSSNAEPFKSGVCYTPFNIFVLLKFNGDINEATDYLNKKYNIVSAKPQQTVENSVDDKFDVRKAIEEARMYIDKEVSPPQVLLGKKEVFVNDVVTKRIFTMGNFSAIIGKAKSRKTFLMTLLTGIVNSSHEGFYVGDFRDKPIILWFDTEQGHWDAQNVVKRLVRLAGDKSDNIYFFALRKYNPYERCAIIEYIFKVYGSRTKLCVIDGVLDLATAMNDEIEATRVVSMLMRLTQEYNCHISCVIHQNKRDNYAIGHIGSAVMRKAEVIVSVSISDTDRRYSIVQCDMSRGAAFEDFTIRVNEEDLPEIVEMKKRVVRNYYDEIEERREEEECPF